MAVLLLVYQMTTNDNLIQNTESNSPIFTSLRAIRTRSVYFVATIFIRQCVSLRYLSTALTACCLFQTERSYHGKTVICAIFQVFVLGSGKLFIKSYFYFLRWTSTLRSKCRRLFVFLWAFWMCMSIVDWNNINSASFFGSPLPLPWLSPPPN